MKLVFPCFGIESKCIQKVINHRASTHRKCPVDHEPNVNDQKNEE